MGTYYGYVDRDVDQQINWQTIGEKISKPFLDREETLKKEHAAAAKNTRDILTDLNNPELGENRNANTLIIDGSVKLSEQQKAYDTLYRQGAITYNEYLQNSQNVKDQTTMFSKIPQLWNEKQKETMAKLNAGEIDAAQSKGYQLLQDVFINPNVAGIVIGKNGNLYLGKKEVGEDGTVTITKDPNNLQSLSNVTSMLGTFNIPKYDVEKEWGKGYGDIKTHYQKLVEEKDPSVFDKGKIKTLDSMLENEDFVKSMNDAAKAIATDPYKASSILIGSIAKTSNGEEYTPVWGTPKAPNEVQLIVDSSGNTQYKLTDEQKKTVEDFLISNAKGKLGREEKVQYEGTVEDVATKQAVAKAEIANKNANTRKTNQDVDVLISNSNSLGSTINSAIFNKNESAKDNSIRAFGADINSTETVIDRDPNTKKIKSVTYTVVKNGNTSTVVIDYRNVSPRNVANAYAAAHKNFAVNPNNYDYGRVERKGGTSPFLKSSYKK